MNFLRGSATKYHPGFEKTCFWECVCLRDRSRARKATQKSKNMEIKIAIRRNIVYNRSSGNAY